MSWPVFRNEFSLLHIVQLAILALFANALYCTAYVLEFFFEGAASSHRYRWRWAIWIIGTLFAIVIESYWINDEMIAPLLH
jgi:hypothetical protein